MQGLSSCEKPRIQERSPGIHGFILSFLDKGIYPKACTVLRGSRDEADTTQGLLNILGGCAEGNSGLDDGPA